MCCSKDKKSKWLFGYARKFLQGLDLQAYVTLTNARAERALVPEAAEQNGRSWNDFQFMCSYASVLRGQQHFRAIGMGCNEEMRERVACLVLATPIQLEQGHHVPVPRRS